MAPRDVVREIEESNMVQETFEAVIVYFLVIVYMIAIAIMWLFLIPTGVRIKYIHYGEDGKTFGPVFWQMFKDVIMGKVMEE